MISFHMRGTVWTSLWQLPFVGYQAQQLVLVLSGPRDPLSPSQAVLLFQRCRVLLACLQHSAGLSKHIRTGFKEEFRCFMSFTYFQGWDTAVISFIIISSVLYRYYVKTSGLEDKLPHHYPISQPAQRLLSQLLGLVLQKPWALALSLSVPLGFIDFVFLQICLWMNTLHFKIEFKSYIVSYHVLNRDCGIWLCLCLHSGLLSL